MEYQAINLKHIREKLFNETQGDFSKHLNIKYMTYQNYENNGIPIAKTNKVREKIVQYANKKGVEVDFKSVPILESLGGKRLEDYEPKEILIHIIENLEDFKEEPLTERLVTLFDTSNIRMEYFKMKELLESMKKEGK